MTDRIDTAKEREKLAALDGHTPGPWFLDGIVVGGLSDEVCFMGEPAQYPGDTPSMIRNCEENARLIAAAPDLKETVAKLCDALDAERAENEWLRSALRIIAGYEQCLDNLMSNGDVARAALEETKE